MEQNYIEDFFGDVYFGDELANDVDWRSGPDEDDPDDEELAVTPKDIIGILGFDPKIFSEDGKVKGLSGIFKHGSHDQSTHGRRSSSRVDNDELEQEARNRVYGFMQGRTDKTEIAEIVVNGVVSAVKGKENNSDVVFSYEQMENMEYLVHNHPGGASFSGQDVAMLLLSPKLKKMEVISPDGALYSLEKLESAMKPDLNIPDLNKLMANSAIYDWNSIMESIRPEFEKRWKAGEDSNALWKEHSHLVMEKLSLEKNLIYKRSLDTYKTVRGMAVKMVSEDQKGGFILDDSSITEPPYGKKGK